MHLLAPGFLRARTNASPDTITFCTHPPGTSWLSSPWRYVSLPRYITLLPGIHLSLVVSGDEALNMRHPVELTDMQAIHRCACVMNPPCVCVCVCVCLSICLSVSVSMRMYMRIYMRA